jgi:hypothetical protein
MSGPINYKGLSAVTATGAGSPVQFHSPRNIHTMQPIVTGGPSACIIDMEGTLSVDGSGNPTGWTKLATWDLAGDPRASGDIVVASETPVTWIRHNLRTLTGGTAPTVTTEGTSESY